MKAIIYHAGVFAMKYSDKLLHAKNTEIMETWIYTGYLPTCTCTPYLRFTRLGKLLIRNKDILGLLEYLNKEHRTGKELGMSPLNFHRLYASND